MSFELIIDSMGNDAFREDPRAETMQIIQNVVDQLSAGEQSGVLHDVNGNPVGHWSAEFPDEEEE